MTKSKIEQVHGQLQKVGRATAKEIHLSTGISQARVNVHFYSLRAQGRAHISAWIRAQSMKAAIWAAGPGEDAPYPNAGPRNRDYKKEAEYCRQWRARQRQPVVAVSPEATIDKARQRPQNPFSALYDTF